MAHIGGQPAPGGASPPVVTQIATQASSLSMPNSITKTWLDSTVNVSAAGIVRIDVNGQFSSNTASASLLQIAVAVDGVTDSQNQPWGNRQLYEGFAQTPTTNFAWVGFVKGLSPGSHHIQLTATATTDGTLWQGTGAITPY